ncbi:MAG: lytic transglycosylase domain-containing protein [Acidobacteriota bacterium]|jgi:soluble lytic murein transglycosylase-like protein/tetratricopeptide (TPR) repeat protein
MTHPVGRLARAVGVLCVAGWAVGPSVVPSAAQPANDPRIPVVERMLAGDPSQALAVAERMRLDSPEAARRWGINYLRGRLLERLQRPLEAEEAFAAALSETPELEPYVRFHLAVAQEREGHPEVAAGLVASVVAPGVPPDLLGRGAELFARAIAAGGDCRILRGVRGHRLPEPEGRLLRVVDGQCRVRQGDRRDAADALCGVLQEDREDDAARRAADLLDDLVQRDPDLREALSRNGCEVELQIGLTFHHHREYERSIPYLERVFARLPNRRIVVDDEEFQARYALARGYFWREQFAIAARRFADLALRARGLEERARVLYQQARSLELLGRWNEADAVFRRTYMTLQDGRFAGPSLLSALRLEWRGGRERDALDLYRLLSNQRGSEEYAARAALFLAVSDVVRGRSDRASGWLDAAERFDRDVALEADYWRGRLAELSLRAGRGTAGTVVGHYLDVLGEAPYHPLALDAAARLRTAELAGPAGVEAARRAAGSRSEHLVAAWLVLGADRSAGRRARRILLERASSNATASAFLRIGTVPAAEWPLWSASLDEAPELLLALGLFDEGAAAVAEHFPANRPELAYTGSRLLLAAREVRRSILLADNASRPLTRRLKDPLQPTELRTTLYPFPWDDLIRERSERFGVDPHLLAAIIREESRFDPDAVSAVSARGLTQFVWLTAKRIAAKLDMGRITPGDLYRPETSITLGAAYLGELIERFGGLEHQAVAAYNAGPAQARLWQTYCYGREAPEYFTKTGFVQTRRYLRDVLGGRAQYEELYGTSE